MKKVNMATGEEITRPTIQQIPKKHKIDNSSEFMLYLGATWIIFLGIGIAFCFIMNKLDKKKRNDNL